jgi:hypothetical protein
MTATFSKVKMYGISILVVNSNVASTGLQLAYKLTDKPDLKWDR